MLYICTKFRENVTKGYRVTERASFSKRHNSVKNVGGVAILNLCTSFDHALYLYQVLQRYPIRFQRY